MRMPIDRAMFAGNVARVPRWRDLAPIGRLADALDLGIFRRCDFADAWRSPPS
jgi:hypothetical protein